MRTKDRIEQILETVTIPTLPSVVARINALLDDPNAGMPEIAAVVTQDASMAAKVLRMANSAYYGQTEQVVSIQRAAVVLGSSTLKNIVLQASLIGRYEHLAGSPDFDPALVWKHAVLTAQVSQSIAKECRAALALDPDEFYTCGLLHDIGKIVFLDGCGDDYLNAIYKARLARMPLALAEERTFGFSHADIGAMVAAHWKLPRAVVAAIRLHHGDVESARDNPNILVVRTADKVANAARSEETPDPDALVPLATRHRLGLPFESLRDALESAADAWTTIQL